VAFAIPAPTEAQAAAWPWHIKNSIYSQANMSIWSETGCRGSSVILTPGESAKSYGWDSFIAARTFNVIVFDPDTGARLADRTYTPGTCVRAYDNDYLITIFYA
jgi:hypothetical protein